MRNELVKQEIKDALKFWLEEKQVDGLRIDAVHFVYEDEEFRDEPFIEGNENVNFKFLKQG